MLQMTLKTNKINQNIIQQPDFHLTIERGSFIIYELTDLAFCVRYLAGNALPQSQLKQKTCLL